MVEADENLLAGYLGEADGVKCFRGDDNDAQAFAATVALAEACPSYVADEEEELYAEGVSTCYNCRYRRWTRTGFSCLKGFPAAGGWLK